VRAERCIVGSRRGERDWGPPVLQWQRDVSLPPSPPPPPSSTTTTSSPSSPYLDWLEAALFEVCVCVCSDDLRVEPDAGSTKLCQSATLRVSGLRNQFTDVLEIDASSVTLSDDGNKL